MKEKIIIKLEICDRNRNFGEIIESIKKVISERDGVDKINIINFNEIHIRKDNHKVGIELESYCNVLEYRGFQDEANKLLEIASRLK